MMLDALVQRTGSSHFLSIALQCIHAPCIDKQVSNPSAKPFPLKGTQLLSEYTVHWFDQGKYYPYLSDLTEKQYFLNEIKREAMWAFLKEKFFMNYILSSAIHWIWKMAEGWICLRMGPWWPQEGLTRACISIQPLTCASPDCEWIFIDLIIHIWMNHVLFWNPKLSIWSFIFNASLRYVFSFILIVRSRSSFTWFY